MAIKFQITVEVEEVDDNGNVIKSIDIRDGEGTNPQEALDEAVAKLENVDWYEVYH